MKFNTVWEQKVNSFIRSVHRQNLEADKAENLKCPITPNIFYGKH